MFKACVIAPINETHQTQTTKQTALLPPLLTSSRFLSLYLLLSLHLTSSSLSLSLMLRAAWSWRTILMTSNTRHWASAEHFGKPWGKTWVAMATITDVAKRMSMSVCWAEASHSSLLEEQMSLLLLFGRHFRDVYMWGEESFLMTVWQLQSYLRWFGVYHHKITSNGAQALTE